MDKQRAATRAEVLAFLRLQHPPMHVDEVTAENLAELRVLYTPNLLERFVLWPVVSSSSRQVIGVLWCPSPDEGPPNPRYIELIERLPSGNRPAWRNVRHGEPVIDDHGVVRIRTTEGALEGLVRFDG